MEGFVEKAYREELGLELKINLRTMYRIDLLMQIKGTTFLHAVSDQQMLNDDKLLSLSALVEELKACGYNPSIAFRSYCDESTILLNYYDLTRDAHLLGNKELVRKRTVYALFHEATHAYFSDKAIRSLYDKHQHIEETICEFIGGLFLAKYNIPASPAEQTLDYIQLLDHYSMLIENGRLSSEELKGTFDKMHKKMLESHNYPHLDYFSPAEIFPPQLFKKEHLRRRKEAKEIQGLLFKAVKEHGTKEVLTGLAGCGRVPDVFRLLNRFLW
ncbi:hypothetical protein HY501_01685 [Candidatus Woesearchaeota archaeon]|nr:hypothetical protein [Candidatus Woesearchaeota archaeon]